MAPRASAQRRLVVALERLREEQGSTRRELAGRLGRTHQWLDGIVAGRSRVTLNDAAVLVESVGARLEVVSSRPDVALHAALAADADLTPEWRDAVWSLYVRGKERATRRGHPLPVRRAVDRFIEPAEGEVPRRKRSGAAASSE